MSDYEDYRDYSSYDYDDYDPGYDYNPYDDYDYDDGRDDNDDYQDYDDYPDYDEQAEDEGDRQAELDDLIAYLGRLRIGEECRRYGYYRCPECRHAWQSARTFCIYKGTGDKKDEEDKVIKRGEGIFEPTSKQACKECKLKLMTAPYKTEKLKVPTVVSITTRGDKAHRADLCLRCINGQSCRIRVEL